MSLNIIKTVLISRFPSQLVDELLDCYQEQKRNYFLGNHRPTEVEGGRFSEAAFRMCEHLAGFSITQIGKQLDTDGLIRKLQGLATTFPDSLRIHIPRTLRVVYDIRNKRDAAHLADGIDPNLQDSSFVFASLDWVLAEFIRLSGGITADKAYELIKAITINAIPVVEDFNGFLKTLNPKLKVSEIILLLLYHCGSNGAAIEQLSLWVKPLQRKNLKATLLRMEHEKDLIVKQKDKFNITRLGILEIQSNNLVEI
ncbi:hypothetical protein [Ferruginibacter sp.]